MEFTRFTIFHVLWLMAVPASAATGWCLVRGYGLLASIACAAATAFLAHIVWLLLLDTIDHYFLNQLSTATNEELRAEVAKPDWRFWHTMALLNLAARDEDVRGELPRILSMLESDSISIRRFGWDALRLVFDEETNSIGDYDPHASADDCRAHVAILRTALAKTE